MRNIVIIILLLINIITFPVAAPKQHTRAEACQWIEDRRTEEWAKDYDLFMGKQCVDLVECYCDYLVGYHLIGDASTYVDRKLPKDWKYVSKPQPGDIAVWEKSKGRKYGHVALVKNVWSYGFQNSEWFSYIEIDGRTGEFHYGQLLIDDPTIYIRPKFQG